MPGYFYILQSETNGHYYIGSTIDPDQRLARHNANAVPEPASIGLIGLFTGGIYFVRRFFVV